MAHSRIHSSVFGPHSHTKVVILSRSYWVKRGDWEIGPVHERQFENMIEQRWFRETDEVRTSEHGAWQSAMRVVPRGAFQADSADEDQAEDELDDDAGADERFEQRPVPKDAPQWFRPRRGRPASSRRAQRDLDEERFDAESEDEAIEDARSHRSGSQSPVPPASDDIHFVTAEIDNREFLAQDRVRVNGGLTDKDFDDDEDARGLRSKRRSDSRSNEEPGQTHWPTSNRKQSSSARRERHRDEEQLEVEVFLDDDDVPDASRSDERRARSHREVTEHSDDSNLDVDFDYQSFENIGRKALPRRRSKELEKPLTRKPEVASALPSEFELDVSAMRADAEARVRKPVTPKKDDLWTHNESGAPADDDTQRKAAESKREFKLQHSEPVDFAKAARLAAEMAAASLPEMPVVESTTPLMTDEERGIRRAIREPHFLPSVRAMLLAIGVQVCVLSVAVNAWCFLAFKRLFILCMEVFIPFQQGSSGEVLLETDLMFCGIAMACTFALPFLPLTYIFKMDGRVLQYLGSLGGAFMAALIFNQVTIDDTSGIVAAMVLLSLPSAVTAGLAITLGVKMAERRSKLLLFGAWAASSLAATAFAVSSPTFGFVNGVREFPPFIDVYGPWGYLAAIGYTAKLSLIYAVLFLWSKHLCDRATREFIMQHIIFHAILSVVGLLALSSVQTEVLYGWASIPAALVALVAIVAQGFNLWSMASHVEPFLSREW